MIERENIFPDGLPKRIVKGHVLYSPVVTVVPGKLVFVSGILARNSKGEIVGKGDMAAQIRQVFENIKTALASVGGNFEHVVKLNSYLTNIEANAAEFREVRASYFPNRSALPASTLLQVPRLASPGYLLEVEVIAVLPPRA